MRETVSSIADIEEIERAYQHGAPTLGHAASELIRRWQLPLRDQDTFLRLAFLCWYQAHEPEWLTGLEAKLPTIDELIAEAGGQDALAGDALFALAVLWHLFCPLGADEGAYRARAVMLAEHAANLEPESRLFREWRYLLGIAPDTTAPRIYLRREVHARYHGRGAMGHYMVHTLLARLLPDTSSASTA